MGRWWRPNPCDRARQWLSLQLDGELSQLERAALARHLAACERCRTLAADYGAITRLLRAAPLEAMSRPVVLAGSRSARARVVRRAAASTLLAGLTAAAALSGVYVAGRTGGTAVSALSFRDHQEQRRFAEVEAQRIEPVAHLVSSTTVRSFASRALV